MLLLILGHKLSILLAGRSPTSDAFQEYITPHMLISLITNIIIKPARSASPSAAGRPLDNTSLILILMRLLGLHGSVHTTVEDHFLHSSRAEEGVECWDAWMQTLRWEIDRAPDRSSLH